MNGDPERARANRPILALLVVYVLVGWGSGYAMMNAPGCQSWREWDEGEPPALGEDELIRATEDRGR